MAGLIDRFYYCPVCHKRYGSYSKAKGCCKQ